MSPKKGGRVLRLKPDRVKLLEECTQIMDKFINGGWFNFSCRFQGHHKEILKLFALNFDGFQS
jgi:hypothetical protein